MLKFIRHKAFVPTVVCVLVAYAAIANLKQIWPNDPVVVIPLGVLIGGSVVAAMIGFWPFIGWMKRSQTVGPAIEAGAALAAMGLSGAVILNAAVFVSNAGNIVPVFADVADVGMNLLWVLLLSPSFGFALGFGVAMMGAPMSETARREFRHMAKTLNPIGLCVLALMGGWKALVFLTKAARTRSFV